MNKLLKVALIGGGAVVLSAVCFDFGTIYATLSDMLKYRKFNAIDKARANFVFHQAIT